MRMESDLTPEQLAARWDERTAPHRFAGGDDYFDDIFIAERRGDRVKIACKPRSGPNMFSTVFRGKIVTSGRGSALSGLFCKVTGDYLLAFVLAVICVTVFKALYERGTSAAAIGAGAFVAAAVLALYLIPKRGAKKKYAELFEDIVRKG